MVKLKRIAIVLFALFMAVAFSVPALPAYADSLGNIKDTLSSVEETAVANHEIIFVTPTGVQASTDTITLDLASFTTGSVDYTDIDLAVDDDNVCDGAWTDKTLAAAADAATWGAAFADGVLTLTPPTDAAAGEITADRCVQIQIGLNATAGVAGNAQLTNPAAGAVTIDLAGVFGDTGTLAVRILTEDDVAVAATVDPTITFSINDTSIGFGSLSATAARWATADGAGTAVQQAVGSGAHELQVSTNADNGYVVTYYGATLTGTGGTITPATIAGDGDGTPTTEQFAIAASTTGDATITSAYDYASDNYSFAASTTTTLVSETGPTSTETVDLYYIANISGSTEAGDYTTSITYIATATF
ncbi:MAG: hypothetical protein PHY34_00740 [Patescibacteria group bacterium]|nr:hypothetical protein [Patescibacteria group bacterium]MDD5715844.1 hypothetical protein [Patescibacteria group bacterium]